MVKNTRQCVIHSGTSRCQRITIETFDKKPGRAIARAAVKFAFDKHLDEFPLLVWQTKSGTQANMNANRVIASRAHEIVGQPLGTMAPVRAADHTFKQSTAGRRK